METFASRLAWCRFWRCSAMSISRPTSFSSWSYASRSRTRRSRSSATSASSSSTYRGSSGWSPLVAAPRTSEERARDMACCLRGDASTPRTLPVGESPAAPAAETARSRSMDAVCLRRAASSSSSARSRFHDACSSAKRSSNVMSISVRSSRSLCVVSSCAASWSRSRRIASAAASTSASLPRHACAASSRRTMVSEYPTHSAMSVSIFAARR
mmetsp:Transcript_13551/g.57852  ORF Transcript_13551/g.57852 Transcript_13551/m.57852 type:complete len:213 (-) Transcript_13551:940-1578(-)